MLQDFQEDIVNVGKYKINYWKVGCGEHKVFCMPGALGNVWSDFKPQVEGFDKKKFTLIVWDAPGCGKSRPPDREFHTDFYGQDVDIAVEFMKVLNIPKFSIMGWCYGGVASIILAAKYPEVVHKLVVWGARSYITQSQIDYCNKTKDFKLWSEQTLKLKIELYGDEFFNLWTKIVGIMEILYRTNDGIVLPVEIMKKVSCPTLLLHGERDPLVETANVYFLRDNIQGSRVHFYPEGKHNIHLRFAEEFNQTVQEFLLKE